MEEVLDAADLVWNANAVLLTAGITQRVTTADEVVQACAQTSMLVAAVEALLQKQIAYVRVPRLQAERAANLDDAVSAARQRNDTVDSQCLGLMGHATLFVPPTDSSPGTEAQHRLVSHLGGSHHIWAPGCRHPKPAEPAGNVRGTCSFTSAAATEGGTVNPTTKLTDCCSCRRVQGCTPTITPCCLSLTSIRPPAITFPA
jgi:hypothetical protein